MIQTKMEVERWSDKAPPDAKLLRRPVVFTVCLECHNGADSLGTRNDGVPLQSSRHNMLDPKFQKCTACHAMIHGSNADPFFLR